MGRFLKTAEQRDYINLLLLFFRTFRKKVEIVFSFSQDYSTIEINFSSLQIILLRVEPIHHNQAS